ncbi:MAG: S8 family peptidase [Oceanospirillaceae bacterium]|nr:S8 family peptidase [Oceanospirillaceae bacterium]
MDQSSPHLKHIDFPIKAQAQGYSGSGMDSLRIPPRNTQGHGKRVLERYDAAIAAAQSEIAEKLPGVSKVRHGYYLEFEGANEHDLNLPSLSAKPLELLSVRQIGDVCIATVFVPKHETQKFAKKIQQYLEERTKDRVNDDGSLKEGNPRHQKLIDSIEEIRAAKLLSLWTDADELFPNAGESIWWEVWVPSEHARDFEAAVKVCGLRLGEQPSYFPERHVYAVLATREQVDVLRLSSGAVAELRRIKETANLFVSMAGAEQSKWTAELVARTKWPDMQAGAICILDTGVNNGHPLLNQALAEEDMHACAIDWPKADTGSPWFHGTAMAGVALYGDLQSALTIDTEVQLEHRLESVRILPHKGNNPEELYGAITSKAVSLVTEQAPDRVRSFSLAVTAPNYFGGRPSEWSATLDGWAFHQAQLFCVSAGNVRDVSPKDDYRSECHQSAIEDPAQSWNGITVGAYTDKIAIDEKDYADWRPIAAAGDLSPHSRTSVMWESQWPIKPEVLFEGGNWAASPNNTEWVSDLDSLSVLTTNPQFLEQQLATFCATSAATAQASYLLARLQTNYPDFWPETHRGLLVHGASWAPEVKKHMDQLNKTDRAIFLKAYGYGVASKEASLFSEKTRCTVISQQVIQPFKQRSKSRVDMKDVHFIKLPHPKEFWEAVGNESVRMRVTLSYFIEPNPSQRGYGYRFSYASHGLRFVLQRPGETLDGLKRRAGRISNKGEEVDEGVGFKDEWFLGPKARNKGSVISDVWEAAATDLAQHEYLAIYPVGGWWNSRPKHGRGDSQVRYSLIVSFETDDTEIDIYGEVEAVVAQMIAAEVEEEITIAMDDLQN